MKHNFTININWPNGRNGVGELTASNLQTNVSIPKEMDGPNIGTNPDEMLLGAASTCYVISLAALLERAEIEATLRIESKAVVDVTNGVFTFERIEHNVSISLQNNIAEVQKKAIRLTEKAERTCMISKALQGNVEILVNVEFN